MERAPKRTRDSSALCGPGSDQIRDGWRMQTRGPRFYVCVCARARAFERNGVRRNDTKSTRREFVRISIWESQVTSSYRYDKREKEEDDSAWTRTKRTFSNTSAHSSSSPLACPTWSLGDAKMGFHCPADRTNRLRKPAAGASSRATTSTVSPTSTTPEP